MAPEQAAGDPNTDARADIYSFGCMAYEMLTGHPLFVGLSPQRLLAAHMAETPPSVAEARPDVPATLAELITKCLEKDPNRRPIDASAILRALDSISATGGRSVRLPVALASWTFTFGAAGVLAKAAIVGIGLPSWVLPVTLVVGGLGLPVVLVTAYVQRTAHRTLAAAPIPSPGGTTATHGTMATLALKASPHLSWRRTVRGGVLAFSILIFCVTAVMVLRAFGIGPAASLLAAGRITAKERVLMTDFNVRSGDSSLAGVVTEALRASLVQSNAITLAAPAVAARQLTLMQLPPRTHVDLLIGRDIARRAGIKAIIDGDITALGGGYVVSVKLVTADSAVTLATARAAVDGPKQLIQAMDDIGRTLRGKIGESLRSVQQSPALVAVTTGSIDALRKYSEGQRVYNGEGNDRAAVPLLQSAVAIDSNFAMAWRLLGTLYSNLNYPRASVDSALGRAYRLRDRLTDVERLRTEATYFNTGPGRDRERALRVYEEMSARGDSGSAANNHGLILMERREYDKALPYLARSARVSRAPGALTFGSYVYALVIAGRLDEARKQVAIVASRITAPTRAGEVGGFEALFAYMAGDLDRSEHLFDSVATFQTAAGVDARGRLGYFALLRGRNAPGLDRIHAEEARNPNPRPVSEAEFNVDVLIRNQPVRALGRLDSALAARPLRTRDVADRPYILVARMYATAGSPAKARGILAERTAEVRDTSLLRSERPAIHEVLGMIAIAEGRPRDAIREFWRSDSLPDGPASSCDICTLANVARAYDKAGMSDSAIAVMERFSASPYPDRLFLDAVYRPAFTRRLGELYEAKGDRQNAVRNYQMFVELWKNADAELQPQVADVRRRLARLTVSERN